ncbi:23S rRNA (guanosine(2251)-2'-O)-methyltransferase RlmB [Anderseniella sp. Alg231-50]|uniref:23S rRNA (guanosine(2251)-2'-O)-methyltransferase RlmB n=1 Tax=Anderseniella sp. Alg231-50 TaxID=1922226 RepID=UPI000D54FB04
MNSFKQSGHKRKIRDKSQGHDRAKPRSGQAPDGNDIIFGLHSVTEALNNPRRELVSLKCTVNAQDRLASALATHPDLEPEVVHRSQLDRITGSDAVHQGAVLTARPLDQPDLDDIPLNGTIVILDQVTDPHNVGAIMRSCAAFSVTALVATARHSPDSSAVMVKSASGAAEHVPFVRVSNLARAMAQLRDSGVTLIGLDSEAPEDIASLDVSAPYAIVLGAEGKGMRRLTRDNCDHLARLDLPGEIRSLNVSNAAALCLYALKR